MKIAFTTNDGTYINAHFGSAKTIDVYEISPEGYQFAETLEFGGNLDEDGNEDKVTAKLDALTDCTIIYVAAIGGTAAARLIGRKVTPIKANSERDEIKDVLDKLVQTLKGSPPPWLRKALQSKSPALSQLQQEVAV